LPRRLVPYHWGQARLNYLLTPPRARSDIRRTVRINRFCSH